MIQGLRTAIYPTPDLARGKEWYRQVLGRDPYFDEPFYVGFSAGGFELGLIPDGEPVFNSGIVCTAMSVDVKQEGSEQWVEVAFDQDRLQGVVNGGHPYGT